MIKCEIEVCAKITKQAYIKESNSGESFISYGISLPVKGKNGETANLNVSVSTDGDKSEKGFYAVGRKIRLRGILTLRKKGENIYYNLRTNEKPSLCKSTEDDDISGTMEFLGKIGKKGVEERTGSKSGKPFKTFSAFSTTKDGDNAEFIWVSFIYPEPKDNEDFLKESTYVSVKGDLQLSVFKNAISLGCRVTDVSPWEFQNKI